MNNDFGYCFFWFGLSQLFFSVPWWGQAGVGPSGKMYLLWYFCIHNMGKLPRTERNLGLAVAVLFLATACRAGERGMPTQEGIGNFGRVNDVVLRGAQPHAAELKSLKRLGVKTIINLRMTNEVWKAEEAEARANGMAYFNVPMSGLGRPTDEQVRKVLAIIASSSGPVFVHCEHGCDRTGTVIACYRIVHDQWRGDAALREAEEYGLSRYERGMKGYIADFAKRRAETNRVPAP
ncbi:Protein tyrosine/serine phosphatase (modular protein) [Verrucomicrobia bacterium]|nr:Protein tyrosine/serine phosphatase (modular protein) [Verrucomicrobiota bacterium]